MEIDNLCAIKTSSERPNSHTDSVQIQRNPLLSSYFFFFVLSFRYARPTFFYSISTHSWLCTPKIGAKESAECGAPFSNFVSLCFVCAPLSRNLLNVRRNTFWRLLASEKQLNENWWEQKKVARQFAGTNRKFNSYKSYLMHSFRLNNFIGLALRRFQNTKNAKRPFSFPINVNRSRVYAI